MSPQPTLDELRAQLVLAEQNLLSASMIDNWERCQRETAQAQARVDSIKARIAEAEAH